MDLTKLRYNNIYRYKKRIVDTLNNLEISNNTKVLTITDYKISYDHYDEKSTIKVVDGNGTEHIVNFIYLETHHRYITNISKLRPLIRKVCTQSINGYNFEKACKRNKHEVVSLIEISVLFHYSEMIITITTRDKLGVTERRTTDYVMEYYISNLSKEIHSPKFYKFLNHIDEDRTHNKAEIYTYTYKCEV